jgi:predicted membrane-bound mannosyltransferase
VWTEAAIVALAVVGFLFAVFRKPAATHPHDEGTAAPAPAEPAPPGWHHSIPIYPPFVRFMGFYTLFLVIGFSVIPYKTPWCLLGFLHGMIVLAGFACGQVVHLLRHPAAKVLASVVCLAAAGQLAWQADRATNNFFAGDVRQRDKFAASNYNPYVYGHTGGDIFTLTRRMREVAQVAPDGERTYVQVVTADMWPIPFYLRGFPKVGYWTEAPPELNGDVIIGTEEVWERLNAEGATRKYQASSFGLRPGVVLWIYVEENLWQKLRELWQRNAPRT